MPDREIEGETLQELDPDPEGQSPSAGDVPLLALGLSRGAYNCLWFAGLHTVAQVAALTDEELLTVRNLGAVRLREIREKLASCSAEPPDTPALSNSLSPVDPIEPLTAGQSPVPANTPIDVLGLSTRPHRTLMREGVVTLGQLAQIPSERILAIYSIGQESLTEIEEKLKTYLAEHPLLPPEPPSPLVDPSLLERVAQIPLDSISVGRLDLPIYWRDRLHHLAIESVGELARHSTDAFDPDSPIVEWLNRYLTWLAGQDESAWADEVAGLGTSPMRHLMLAETTLDNLVWQWLGILNERERLILQWRYGFRGRRLTQDEVGERLNVTRERIRQLQSRALKLVTTPQAKSSIWPLVALLRQTFAEAGGLMTETEVKEAVVEAVEIEDGDPEWAGRLILHTFDQFQEVIKGYLWGLVDAPLHLVFGVSKAMIDLLREAQLPLSYEQVIADFKATGFYQEHRDDLGDTFIAACLRTDQMILLTDGQYALAEWTREPAADDSVGLQDSTESGLPIVDVEEERRVDDQQGQQISLEGEEQHPITELPVTAVPAGPPVTLADWEAYLLPRVRQVELLGEIPITTDEYAQLGQSIGRHVERWGHAQALRTLRRDYPCALAMYLVAQGIHGYEGGDYWTEVVQEAGFSPKLTSQVGRAFEQILEELQLPLFYDMRAEGARRYVSLILAHGGIPNYCLPDFFNNMLQPAIVRAQYADMSAAELIDEWQWRSSAQHFTDKPVIRFLVYGGRVAEDFVERCRQMAREYLDSGIVPGAEEVGLPERVVGAYRQWIAEQDAGQIQRESSDRWRLRKPEVLVDPWGEGVILDLPPQQVPATELYADVAWQVMAGGEEYIIPVRVRRSGFDRKTEPRSIPLSQPSEMYEVSLLVDGQAKRTWRYQGVSEERPLLVFNADRSTLIAWTHSLPARRLGIYYPVELELRVEGNGQSLEELDRMPWGWSGFRGEAWDLTEATRLVLVRQGKEVLAAALWQDESVQRPRLVGGEPLLLESSSVRAPVYVGPPPSVRIPLSGRRDLEEELARWRLAVRNRWTADPEQRVTMTLGDLHSELTLGEGFVDLPLSLPSLLGETPYGNFFVQLRGPLGHDAEFTLRIVPHLTIRGHESLYLPDAQSGPQPVTLLVETSPGDHLEYQGEESECRVQAVERTKDRSAHKVEVGPDVTEVELAVVHPLPAGDPVRVPVSVGIRRLRWTLVGERMEPGQREWTGRTIKRSVDGLLQIQSPLLLVRLPLREANQVRLGLRLLDVDSAELQVTDLAPSAGNQQLWRFDLAAFLDTTKASRSPILRFELIARNLPGREDLLRLPVLSLTRTLLVDDVELEPRRAESSVVFELRWNEPAPLRNRHVRFWPLWRSWDPVVERSIPDDVEGMWTLDVPPTDFRSGKYRVEFLVVDPWVPEPIPQMPPPGTPGTADVELIPPDRQLQYLDARTREQGERFELLLERAIVCRDAGDPQAAQSGLQWCYQHLDDGTIPQILALVELVETAGDPATHRALQLKMFAASRVESLLRAYARDEVSPDHYRRYLGNLPRSGLLPKATCERLLSVEDETVRLHAVQQLIRRGDATGADAVLTWVEDARLSDADANALLALNPNFAAEYLQERTGDPVARRLLEGLSRSVAVEGEIIRVGDWVHSNVGWGRIDRIVNPRTHAEADWIAGKQSRYLLHVTLRPNVFPESIVVDLASESTRFLAAGRVITCTECKRFSTQHKDVLWQHFQKVHPIRRKREAKLVTSRIAYRLDEGPISLHLLEFISEKPSDQLT